MAKVKTNQQGFSPIIIGVLILAVFAIAGIGYYVATKDSNKKAVAANLTYTAKPSSVATTKSATQSTATSASTASAASNASLESQLNSISSANSQSSSDLNSANSAVNDQSTFTSY